MTPDVKKLETLGSKEIQIWVGPKRINQEVVIIGCEYLWNTRASIDLLNKRVLLPGLEDARH